MNKKKTLAALLALVIVSASSCGEPNVVSNGLGENGGPSLYKSSDTSSDTSESEPPFETTPPEDVQITDAVSEPEDTTHADDSGMIPNPLNEQKHNTMSAKLDELGAVEFGEIETLNTLIAAIGTEHGDYCDIYMFRGNSSELLFRLPRSEALTAVDLYAENREQFLVIYDKGAVGRGYPATVITIKDDEPLILSKYDSESGELPALFYLPDADLVCKRGAGTKISNNSVIPYHWNGTSFVPYRLHQITVSELETLDTDNTVINAYAAVSIYRRENGLVHVNYIEASGTQNNVTDAGIASLTYVYEDDKLRLYNVEKDLHYGFFDTDLPVTDNVASGSASETDSGSFEIQG